MTAAVRAPRVLMVLTSHATLGTTGRATGLWLEEFAAPYYVLTDAGIGVSLSSPLGGQPPIDPVSDEPGGQTDATRRFHQDVAAQDRLATTLPLAEVSAGDFDAVFFPGGHGPLWDLPDNPSSIALIEAFVAADKPVAAVCHAPVAFAHVTDPDGSGFLAGRQVTAFSDSEEAAVGLTDVVPELLEDMLVAAGAHYSKGPTDFDAFVVVDGRLITGQNPASSAPAARALLAQLLPDARRATAS
jgi:putative intracellular protease/amidase